MAKQWLLREGVKADTGAQNIILRIERTEVYKDQSGTDSRSMEVSHRAEETCIAERLGLVGFNYLGL